MKTELGKKNFRFRQVPFSPSSVFVQFSSNSRINEFSILNIISLVCKTWIKGSFLYFILANMDETKQSKKRGRSLESDHPPIISKKKRGEKESIQTDDETEVTTCNIMTMEEELDCKNSIKARNIAAENSASQPKNRKSNESKSNRKISKDESHTSKKQSGKTVPVPKPTKKKVQSKKRNRKTNVDVDKKVRKCRKLSGVKSDRHYFRFLLSGFESGFFFILLRKFIMFCDPDFRIGSGSTFGTTLPNPGLLDSFDIFDQCCQGSAKFFR